jgi:hypothetical protein
MAPPKGQALGGVFLGLALINYCGVFQGDAIERIESEISIEF